MHIATSGSKIEISKESLTAKIDKKFSKAEQEYLSTIFSNQKVSSLKSFLNNSNSDAIENRMKSELHRSIDLPKAKKNEIKEKKPVKA